MARLTSFVDVHAIHWMVSFFFRFFFEEDEDEDGAVVFSSFCSVLAEEPLFDDECDIN